MNIHLRIPSLIPLFLWFICLPISISAAQTLASQKASVSCEITDISPQSRTLRVTVTIIAANDSGDVIDVRFADEFAGIRDLSQRVSRLRAVSGEGENVPVELRGGGVFSLKPARPTAKLVISWEARLARAMDPGNYALISGLGQEAGFLMMSDLLPQICSGNSASCQQPSSGWHIRIVPPNDWQIISTAGNAQTGVWLRDVSQAVFFLGRLRQRLLDVPGLRLRVAIAGQWNFTDDQVAKLAAAIAEEHLAMTGGLSTSRPDETDEASEPFLVTLAPYPIPMTGLRSSALTRHHTVVMMLNQSEDAPRTFTHYAKHLAHEMFHYYLPGAFRITENFDWFWEGFTRYIAVLTLQRLRLLTLQAYLDALSEEYDAYYYNPLRSRLSLIAASPEKFANLANYDLVYRKGMLVAALYDLELRYQSNGARNLMEVIRTLHQNYALRNEPVGNREVLQELGRAGNFKDFIQEKIEGTRDIDLEITIKPYGLIIERTTVSKSRPRIVPAQKLSAKQQVLLAQLGR